MPSYISSRHNPTVMLAASLSDKKNRERERLFRFDGKNCLPRHVPAVLTSDTFFCAKTRSMSYPYL